MVTIVGFEKRKNSAEEEFNVLILQGGVEAIISQQSGKPYITARKTSIPCTFGDEFAKSLIGNILLPRYKFSKRFSRGRAVGTQLLIFQFCIVIFL